PVTGYTGTVTFTSTDTGKATALPLRGTLVNGVGVFTATLTTAGSQTLTASAKSASGPSWAMTGTSGPITVSAATATHFAVSAPGATTAGAGFRFTVI